MNASAYCITPMCGYCRYLLFLFVKFCYGGIHHRYLLHGIKIIQLICCKIKYSSESFNSNFQMFMRGGRIITQPPENFLWKVFPGFGLGVLFVVFLPGEGATEKEIHMVIEGSQGKQELGRN